MEDVEAKKQKKSRTGTEENLDSHEQVGSNVLEVAGEPV